MKKHEHNWQFEALVTESDGTKKRRYFCTKCWAKTERELKEPNV